MNYVKKGLLPEIHLAPLGATLIGTTSSKINVTSKAVHLPISKLHYFSLSEFYLLIITKVKFVTAVKLHYRVLQFF